MNFFGSRKKTTSASKPATKTPIEAIGAIKEQIRLMEKGSEHLEKRIKKCHMDALKKSKAKNKRGAMLDLKRKKLLEKQLSQKQAQQMNLETQLFALENAIQNKQNLDSMKHSTNAMNNVMNSV
jgi:charged multivesicular body protein 4